MAAPKLLTIREAAQLEMSLHHAMERAIRQGWYPRTDDTLWADGGCCILGAIMVPSARYNTLTGCVHGDSGKINKMPFGLTSGFDGNDLEEGEDRRVHAIGRRMARRYLVQGGS